MSITLNLTPFETGVLAKVLGRADVHTREEDEAVWAILRQAWDGIAANRAPRTFAAPDPESCLLKDDEVDLGDDVEAHDFATCRYCIEDATYFLNRRRITAHLLSENLR